MTLERNIKKNPGDVMSMLKLSEALLAADRDLNRAEKLLSITQSMPQLQAKSSLLLGKIAYRRGDLVKANSFMESIENMQMKDELKAEGLLL